MPEYPLRVRLPAPYQGRGQGLLRFDVSNFTALVPFFDDLLERFEYGGEERRVMLSQTGQLMVSHLQEVYSSQIAPGNQFPTEYTGNFGNSLAFDAQSGPEPHQLRVSVVSRGVDYASYLEEGGPPQEVSSSEIEAWAEEKGFSFTNEHQKRQAIRNMVKQIRTKGTEPRYLFRDAFGEGLSTSEPFYLELQQILDRYVEEAIGF